MANRRVKQAKKKINELVDKGFKINIKKASTSTVSKIANTFSRDDKIEATNELRKRATKGTYR